MHFPWNFPPALLIWPMRLFRELQQALLHFCYPQICAGCGNDLPGQHSTLCLRCIESLPETNFERYAGNPVEKTFWGRLPLQEASAQFYFNKATLVQHLMHRLKYRGDQELGLQLGRIMGVHLLKSGRFETDALVPLPLFPARERKRGYNQATVLCRGMAEMLRVPVLDQVVSRPQHTSTQTRKGRIERWKNMEGKFLLTDPAAISYKKILLVDDVITTGATLESCGTELLKAPGIRLSIATLCYAAR